MLFQSSKAEAKLLPENPPRSKIDGMKTNYYAVIMAGGLGARLWPLSRKKKPKQLHSLMTEEPMIRDTYLRLLSVFNPDKIVISTIPDFVADIKKILPEIPRENYIVEPALMGNAAACGLVSEFLYARNKDSMAFFMPADAYISNPKEFQRVIRYAQQLMEKYPKKILTIGIKPSKPEVGYGYIKIGQKVESNNKLTANNVQCFVEKPNLKTAEKYFKSNRFLWNAGIFAWRTDFMLGLFEKYLPKTFECLENIGVNIGKKIFPKILKEEYAKVENTSIDFGIIEKTKDIIVIPAEFGWSDVGSWGSLFDVLAGIEKTDSVRRGHHIGMDNSGCLVLGANKLIATIGLKNIAVIDTPDAILICGKDQSHKVKDILKLLGEEYL